MLFVLGACIPLTMENISSGNSESSILPSSSSNKLDLTGGARYYG